MSANLDATRPDNVKPEDWYKASPAEKKRLVAADLMRQSTGEPAIPPPAGTPNERVDLNRNPTKDLVGKDANDTSKKISEYNQSATVQGLIAEKDQKKDMAAAITGQNDEQSKTYDQIIAQLHADHAQQQKMVDKHFASLDAASQEHQKNVQALIAAGNPDPNRYFHNRSTGQAILDTVGAVATGILSFGMNTHTIQDKVTNDVNQQMQVLEQRRKGVELEGQGLTERTGVAVQDAAVRSNLYAQDMGSVKVMLDAALARTNDPVIKANLTAQLIDVNKEIVTANQQTAQLLGRQQFTAQQGAAAVAERTRKEAREDQVEARKHDYVVKEIGAKGSEERKTKEVELKSAPLQQEGQAIIDAIHKGGPLDNSGLTVAGGFPTDKPGLAHALGTGQTAASRATRQRVTEVLGLAHKAGLPEEQIKELETHLLEHPEDIEATVRTYMTYRGGAGAGMHRHSP